MKTIIKNKRIALNWKLKDLANRMNLDSTLVSRFETGSRLPTKDQVIQLAQVLDLSESELMQYWLRDKILADYGKEEGLKMALTMVNESLPKYRKTEDHAIVDKTLVVKIQQLDLQVANWRAIREQMHQKMIDALLLEYTYESNRIEGNTLTLQETDLVIQHGLTIAGKTMREHLEAINHHDAIDFVRALATEKKPISERDILQIHNLVLRGIDQNEAGRMRRHAVIITGAAHVPPQPEHLREEMDNFMAWYKKQFNVLHPVLMAADIHEKFVTIHPFIDGNGRTSRLLMNLHLMQHGYPITIIKGDVENRLRYYKALDDGRLKPKLQNFRKLITGYVNRDLERWISLAK